MQKKTFQFLCFILVLSLNCCQNYQQEGLYQLKAEATLIPIIQEFETTAAGFGFTVKIDNLVIETRSTLPPHMQARAEIRQGQRFITINSDYHCWADGQVVRSQRYREILLFHELSHLYLSRQHTEGRDPVSGHEFSLMTSNLECNSQNFYVANLDLRPYYMKELFTRERDIDFLRSQAAR